MADEQQLTAEEQDTVKKIHALNNWLEENQFSLVDLFTASTSIIRYNFDTTFFTSLDESQRKETGERVQKAYDDTVNFLNGLDTESVIEDVLILLSVLEFAILPAVKEVQTDATRTNGSSDETDSD